MSEPPSEERMCVPEEANFDKLNRILIAYLKAGANEKAVSYRDASIRSGIAHTRVSANNKFFVHAGFLEEAQRGRFRLTGNGAKYAQLMDWGRLDSAKKLLGEILRECSLISIAIDYVHSHQEVPRDDLRRYIGSVAEVRSTRRFVTGINALIDMLAFSGLLQEKDGMFKRGEEIEAVPGPPPISAKKEGKRPVSIVGFEVAKPKDVSIPVSLTVNVTETTDIQKLRDILRAIREELLEEKETE